jgi:hypothetical protein
VVATSHRVICFIIPPQVDASRFAAALANAIRNRRAMHGNPLSSMKLPLSGELIETSGVQIKDRFIFIFVIKQ